MKKSVAFAFLMVSILFFSCREKGILLTPLPSEIVLSGTIHNWSLGSGKELHFDGSLRTYENSPVSGTMISLTKTRIDLSGSFAFNFIPSPPDSLFIITTTQTDTTYANCGMFSGSNYPFMHDYAVISSAVTDKEQWIGSTYCSNDSLGYLGFIGNTSPIGIYSVIFEYVDRPFAANHSFSHMQDGYETTWQYDLKLVTGWNTIFIMQKERANGKKLILISEKVPDH
ncbi:MAG: hypothetical protein HYV28_21355 [Ignavibacteriales bacterium]|nr:hypothetical protein [Ignavibacteriales bacterium]